MSNSHDTDFQTTIDLFDDFLVKALKKDPSAIESGLAYEASECLRQMQFLLFQIRTITEHIHSGRPLNFGDFEMPIQPSQNS